MLVDFQGPLAILADIHGNTWALDSVLAHAKHAGAKGIVNLGDFAYGPLDPQGTVDRLQSLDCPAVHIQGNEDRVLWECDELPAGHSSWTFTRSRLSSSSLQWIRQWSAQRSEGEFLLCHGSPGDDTEYLLETVTPRGLRNRHHEELSHRLEGRSERIILCGHSHLPGCVRTVNGTLIINPGSVGLQAYMDDIPHPHRVETRSPHARYALLDRIGQAWCATMVAVPYDWEAAARAAELNGRPDWAHALRTGWVNA